MAEVTSVRGVIWLFTAAADCRSGPPRTRGAKIYRAGDVIDTTIRFEPYAYVIYDLDHRQNADLCSITS